MQSDRSGSWSIFHLYDIWKPSTGVFSLHVAGVLEKVVDKMRRSNVQSRGGSQMKQSDIPLIDKETWMYYRQLRFLQFSSESITWILMEDVQYRYRDRKTEGLFMTTI